MKRKSIVISDEIGSGALTTKPTTKYGPSRHTHTLSTLSLPSLSPLSLSLSVCVCVSPSSTVSLSLALTFYFHPPPPPGVRPYRCFGPDGRYAPPSSSTPRPPRT